MLVIRLNYWSFNKLMNLFSIGIYFGNPSNNQVLWKLVTCMVGILAVSNNLMAGYFERWYHIYVE